MTAYDQIPHRTGAGANLDLATDPSIPARGGRLSPASQPALPTVRFKPPARAGTPVATVLHVFELLAHAG